MAEDFQIICPSQSKPLSELKQLLDWDPTKQCADGIDAKQYCLSRLETHKTDPNTKFKTLVCHDMKGGYLDDRYNDGTDNETAFRFFVWSSIDIFIYFSHNLVTIPPIAWINASHKNGVPILGTFIVEGWTQTNDIMSQILNSSETLEMVVTKLVEMAQFYHFEGWLINIECEIDPKCIQSLITFIKLLTDTMHTHNPHSVVSPEGELKWQNQLNSSNKCFFDVCDAIFLNYCWTEDNLKSTYHLSHSLSRNYDVFVGIDVFGRNCFGGGGMNTHLAVKEILKHNLSIAIFASGWTHEVLGSENFTNNEYLFWSSLDLGVHHWPKSLPISTSFCQGFGLKYYRKGRVLSEKSWHNLNLQPSYQSDVKINISTAFNGGGCLQLNKYSVRLFRCEIPIKRCFYGITFKTNCFQKLMTCLKYETNESNENKTLNLFSNGLHSEEDNNFAIEYINDYKLNKQMEKFTKYGIFETYNNWVTQAVIIQCNNPELRIIINSIELKVFNASEEEAPDILIGQMVFDSI